MGQAHRCRAEAGGILYLDGCHCCRGALLVVRCNCPHSIAGLVDCHLPSHVQQDLGLRTCLDVSCRYHSCGDNTGSPSHTISLELLGRPSCRGRTDHGHPPTSLASCRHRDFSLGSICHRPCDWCHIIARENPYLAGMHGCPFEPAILAALKH